MLDLTPVHYTYLEAAVERMRRRRGHRPAVAVAVGDEERGRRVAGR